MSRFTKAVIPFIEIPRLVKATTISPRNGCVRPDSSAKLFDVCAISTITVVIQTNILIYKIKKNFEFFFSEIFDVRLFNDNLQL